MDNLLAELIEQEILVHGDYINAVTDTREHPDNQPPITLDALRTWPSLIPILRSLAFAPTATDPWTLVGIPKYEGPPPTTEMIMRRVALAHTLTSVCLHPGRRLQESAETQHFLDRLDAAGKQCIGDLPHILREKRKWTTARSPRWLEAGTSLLRYLHDRATTAERPTTLLLHMSNLQEIDFTHFPLALPPLTGRQHYEALTKSAATIHGALQAMSGKDLYMWAPMDTDTMQRLARAFKVFAATATATTALHLLVPHDVYPGCRTPTDIQDLWGHVLMEAEWKPILSCVEYLRQPVRCVFPGQSGPLHHVKAIAVLRLSTCGATTPPVTLNWRPTLLEDSSGPAIVVDFYGTEELSVHGALKKMLLPGLIRWDGPRRSLGSKGPAQRLYFVGFFDESHVTDLDMHLYVDNLRNQDPLNRALIGRRALFTDRTAMVVDMGSPTAIEAMRDWTNEVVLVSARRALIRTAWSAEHWAHELSDQHTVTPLDAITRVRHRPSILGGRTWAKPQALPTTRRRAVARASRAPTTPSEARRISLSTSIVFSDSPSGHSDSLPGRLMTQISTLTGTPWQMQQEGGPLLPRRWRSENEHRITAQCSTVDDLNQLYHHIHNASMEIDGMPCLVEVENLFHDAPPAPPIPPYTAAPSPASPLEVAMDGAFGT